MKEKIDKYWSEYSVVFAFWAILDPTKKLNFLKYIYLILNPRGYTKKLERTKKTLYALFEEYNKNGALASMTSFAPKVSQPPRIARGEKEKLSTYDIS